MKKTLMVLFASLVLTGCAEIEEGYEDGKDAVEDEVVQVVEDEVVEDEVEDEVEPVVEDEPVEDELSRDQSIRLVELMMIESFEDSGDVSYSIIHDALVYTPTDPGFTNELAQMVLGLMDRSEWDGVVESFRELSGIVSDNVDEDLGIIIVNPENEDLVLLIVRNGVVDYDFMDEQ